MKRKLKAHRKHKTGGGPKPPKFTPMELEFLRVLGDTPSFQGLADGLDLFETTIEVVKAPAVSEKDAAICLTTLQAGASVMTKALNTSKPFN